MPLPRKPTGRMTPERQRIRDRASILSSSRAKRVEGQEARRRVKAKRKGCLKLALRPPTLDGIPIPRGWGF